MKVYLISLAILFFTGNIKGVLANEGNIPRCAKRPGGNVAPSQQAIECLVGSWKDVTTWPKRNEPSSLCEQDVERMIFGYLNNEYWALRIFDAWGKPGPSLLDGRWTFVGNYRQCRDATTEGLHKKVGFRGNYCAVTLNNLTHIANPNFPLGGLHRAILGVCLPSSCSENDITALFHQKIEALNIASLFTVAATDCRSDEKEHTTFTRVSIAIILIIGALTVIGTVIDVTSKLWLKRTSSTQENHHKKTDGDEGTTAGKIDAVHKLSTIDKFCGFTVDVLLSFSVWTNWQRLVNTAPAPGSIPAISGIRFFTMTWILFGHALYYLLLYASNITQGLDYLFQYRLTDGFLNMFFGVDTFFAISGFLVSYNWIKIIIEKGWKLNWVYFYFHRYWRLTPSYIATIVLVQGLQRFVVGGAMSPTYQPVDKENCHSSWWLNALYINNIFRKKNPEMCFPHAWSLAVDMQFYIVSPLMLVPFYYHRFAGIASCLLFAIFHFILAGSVAYNNDWKIGRSFGDEWWEDYYIPFYTRIAPFAFGIVAGYVLSVNGGRLKMKSYQVIVGWTLTVLLMLYIVFGVHGDYTGDNPSSFCTSILYFATSKGIWGACTLWIVVACASGYGGPVNAILSWPPFNILGRVTYMAYLIQMSVITIILENLEQPMFLNYTSVFVIAIAGLLFTIPAAAVVTICIEFPTLNLEKVLLGRKKH